MTSQPVRDLASWREEYSDRGLSEDDLPHDPIAAFITWLEAANSAGVHEPNAMVVSSVGDDSAPSSRLVLLKSVDARGFVFYTHLDSRKGRELQANAACALLFPWHALQRQVRIEGTASVVPDAEADDYSQTRPRESQLGAWASPQSWVVEGREALDAAYEKMLRRFDGVEHVPRPHGWSGFLVRPHTIEFWQGRPGRIHDRILYERLDEHRWQTSRLAP
jgi:pyridoxamine 5'-phosphate oxidase